MWRSSSFGSDRPRTLIEGAAAAVALPDNRILFTQSGALFAAQLDPQAKTLGPSTKLADGVADDFAASMDGTVAFFETADQNRRSLVWVDRRGREEPIGDRRGGFNHVSLSPDGSRLAVEVAEGVSRRAISLYDLKTGAFHPMTFGNVAEFPVWSPDGSRLAFSQSGDNRGIYWQMADASQPAERLFATGNSLWPGSWSPDGRRLAYMESRPTTSGDIGVFDIGGQPKLLIQGPATEWGAKLSPDGRCLAYVSQETGDWEVSVRRFPDRTPGCRCRAAAAPRSSGRATATSSSSRSAGPGRSSDDHDHGVHAGRPGRALPRPRLPGSISRRARLRRVARWPALRHGQGGRGRAARVALDPCAGELAGRAGSAPLNRSENPFARPL